jgi:hypothetical protein
MLLTTIRIVCLFFVFNSSLAEASWSKKYNLNLAIGLQFNTVLHKRGIVTYGGNQLIPIYSLTLFTPNLLLAGSALYYKLYLYNKNFYLRSRLNFDSTGDEPLYYTSEEEDERVRRDKTNELDLYLEYVSNSYYYFRFQSTFDLEAHHGKYLEAYFHAPLVSFNFSSKKNEMLLGYFASIGTGDKRHNEYFYGDGAASSGLNNTEYGLTLRSPKVIDFFWNTLKVSRFEILDKKNQEASFVKDGSGWALEALIAFGI